MASGSVDQKNTYVFEVLPKAVLESASKNLAYWSTGNGDDTMVTLWNPADEAQDFVFTLFFSGGHYDLPIHLEARAARIFNVSEIVQNQIPDQDGNLIPPNLHEGSARISGPHADNEALLVAVDAGVYNVRKATCGYICNNCNGMVSFSSTPSSFDLKLPSGQVQINLSDVWNTGVKHNLTSTATWSSSKTSVATVSKGLTKAVAVGSAVIDGFAGTDPWAGQVCGSPPPACPPEMGFDGQSSANVKPTISGGNTVWWFNGKAPNPASYPILVTLTSSGGASTTWSVSQADTKVNLSSTTGGTVTVSSSGINFSGATGDISITATANGAPSDPFLMTAKTPWKLASLGPPQTTCYTSPETYGSVVNYNLVDNLGVVMSSNVDFNEVLGTQSSQNGSNWGNYSINQSSGPTNPVQDELQPPNLNVSPVPSPTPTCTGNNSGTTRYRAIPQNVFVGSSIEGAGVQAQSDTLGYYIDHGQHDSIQVPAQPPQ
jgi:hypothetical protein